MIEVGIRDLIIVIQFGVIVYLLYKDWYVDWRRLRKIKKSGDHGEKMVSAALDELDDVFEIYHGLKGEFERQHFEIDHLLLVHQGILLIETKNIRGTIISKRDGWCQIKKSESGKSYERDFKSPIYQVDRTSRIFESFLASKGVEVKVVPAIVFSNPDVTLKLPRQKHPVLKLSELNGFLDSVSRDVPLTTRQLRKLKQVLDEAF